MSTLLRETQPAQNRIAGYLPQHADENGDYVATGENAPMPVKINLTKGMLPIQKQGNLFDYKQTHAGVSIGASAYSDSTWFPTGDAESLKLVISTDAAFTYTVVIQWSYDGSTFSGEEPVTLLNGNKSRNASPKIDVAAPYFRVSITNGTTSAHVFSAWATLKV